MPPSHRVLDARGNWKRRRDVPPGCCYSRSDARRAAAATEHGRILVTTYADFNRFRGLPLQHPRRSR
jgi:predicted nucleic acid-binding protein